MSFLDTLKAKLGLSKGALVGVEFASDAIYVAQLAKGKGGYQVQAMGKAPLPMNSMQDGEIVDPVAAGSALRELMDSVGIQAERAVVALGGQCAFIRLINTEVMEADELSTYIAYEAERYIPFSLEDVNIDSQILGNTVDEGGNDQMEVLLVAAQKNLVTSYIDAIQEAGLTIQAADVASFSVLRALERTGYIEEGGTVAALLIQGPTTDINVLSNGVPKFNRSVMYGYNHLVDNLMTSLGVDEDGARELLDGMDVDPQDYEEVSPDVEQATEIVRPALSEMTGEISRSLEYFMSTTGASIDRIVLCGRGAALTGLDRFLTTRLGIEAVIGDPLSTLGTGGAELDEAQAPTFVTAIGAAMRGLDGP